MQMSVSKSHREGHRQSKGTHKSFRYTRVKVEPSVVLKSEADLEAAAWAIVSEVEPSCFISNSITAKVNFAPRLRVASAVQS